MSRLHPSAYLPCPHGASLHLFLPCAPHPLLPSTPGQIRPHLCLEPSLPLPLLLTPRRAESFQRSSGPASGSPSPPEPHFLPHIFVLYMHLLLQPQRLPAIPRSPCSCLRAFAHAVPSSWDVLPDGLTSCGSQPPLYNSSPAPHCSVLPSTAVICAPYDGRSGEQGRLSVSCRALPQRARVSVISLGGRGPSAQSQLYQDAPAASALPLHLSGLGFSLGRFF